MAGGVLYATGGTRRAVVALDAATGELLWVHSEHEGRRAEEAPRLLSGRGLAYWTDGEEERILYVTLGFRLVALDAKTGRRAGGFGQDGLIDLKAAAIIGDGRPIDLVTGEIGLHATPTVARDVVIVGGTFADAPAPKTHNNTKGLVQAFDVRSGRHLWTFNTVPRPGEFGVETWLNDSWGINGNNGVWTQISADPELGIVYLPVETPSGDYYGGHRPGNNLFGESLVAVDLLTGERKWHFQLVHHPLWGFDMASPAILADITVDGRPIQAVAQPGKQAFLYVFDRVTGEPVWPIEERPVPQGDVPGEWYSPTQPFPTRPPAYDRQGSTIDDLIDFTPGAARRGGGAGVALQARAHVHAAGHQPARGPDRHARPGRRQRRHELAGRRLRPRDPHPLRAVAHRVLLLGADPDARSRGVGHALRQGDREVRRGTRRPARPQRARAAAGEAALRPPVGHRPRPRRDPVADAARRDARPREEPPGAARASISRAPASRAST